MTEARCRPGVDLYCAEDATGERATGQRENAADRMARRREERRQDARERREEERLERRERIAERRRRLRDDDPDYYRSGRAATDTVVGVTVPLVALGALGAFLGGGFGGNSRSNSSDSAPPDAGGGDAGGGDAGHQPAPVGPGGGIPGDQTITDRRTNRKVDRHPTPEQELASRIREERSSPDPGNELAAATRERVREAPETNEGNRLAGRARRRTSQARESDPGNELAAELNEKAGKEPDPSDELTDRVRGEDPDKPRRAAPGPYSETGDTAFNVPAFPEAFHNRRVMRNEDGRFTPRTERGAAGGAVSGDQQLTDERSSRADRQPGGA